MTTKCLPKKQDLKKINRKYHLSRCQRRKILGQKMKRTQVKPQANEPIEVDDDVSHEASENKEQGKFQSCWASLCTWLTYDKDKNKMYCSKCISIGANNTMTAVYCSRIPQNCLNCWKSFSSRGPPYPGLMAHYFWWWWAEYPSSSKARVISVESSKF